MRFLTVTHFFESHGGGIERVAGRLCRELAAAGHHSAWLASAADEPPTDPTLEALPVPCFNPTERLTGLPMPIPGPKGLAALSKAIARCDIVIIHDCLYATSVAAFLLARRQAKPVILIQHIAAIPFRAAMLRGLMRLANMVVTRRMLAHADQVVFISDTVRAEFAEHQGKRPARLLFNGVATEVFHRGDECRSALGLPQSGKLIVFAGRLVEKKGLATIEALARLRSDLSFALAGSGPIDPAAWALGNVHCLGALSQDDLARLYRMGDVLVLPSVGEGYPLVIQEAMACGLPVLCSEECAVADPGAARFLQGVQIDPSDPDGNARRIAAMIDEPTSLAKRDVMATYAAQTYSWSAMARAIGDIGQTITGHPLVSGAMER